jgi:hypothetical protein
LLFFYYECRQENRAHEPNLCIIQNEAGDEWTFQGDNTRNDFCECLFIKQHENHIVMAHNFQGYDKYDIIMHGAKVFTLSVPMFKIRFIDP